MESHKISVRFYWQFMDNEKLYVDIDGNCMNREKGALNFNNSICTSKQVCTERK